MLNGDLISRSALLEKLEELIEYDTFDIYKEEPLINISWETLEDIISNQPIAYDVDRVVEELDKEKVFMIDEYTEEHEAVVFLDEAIEIVRGGGVNE